MDTGRKCTWCGLREILPETIDEWEEYLAQPSACCAPDGDGHLWVFPPGYSWNNPLPKEELSDG